VDFVKRLYDARRAERAEIAVAVSGGRVHHLAALWPVALGERLRRALVEEGLRKVESFTARFAVAKVEWPSEPLDPFSNLNTPEDLASAETASRSRSL
jgi:molybdopterin-guanine dinucleotide biosynthesis protein A